MKKTDITKGITYLEVPEINLRILCGCPENSIKFIMQKDLTPSVEVNGYKLVGGPNAVLLNDLSIKNSHFLNFAEFPVLHHRYFQGAAFNGTDEKFTIIGIESRVKDQYKYIRCGKNGIEYKEEMIDAGISDDLADKFLAISNYHRRQENFENIIESVYLKERTEVRDGLFIERKGFNLFEFTYNDESVIIDLNLDERAKGVGLPYNIDHQNISFDEFSITTIGDGNGWNPEVPCLGAMITASHKRFLVDSGPGSLDLIWHLGVTPSEVDGIFVTHSHDDHFAGILSMLNSERKIKFFSSRVVIRSVQLKFLALLQITLDELKQFIDFIPLEAGKWTDIGDMEVKPNYSFHPVETNVFYFRKMDENGEYKVYGHITDIAARKDVDYMLEHSDSEIIKADWVNEWFSHYLEPCHLKRIDAGGGVVHGDSHDFISDNSDKIILSHLSHDISTDESPNFCKPTPFGHTEILITSTKNNYLPIIADLLNEIDFPYNKINPDNIIYCEPGDVIEGKNHKIDSIYLVLSGLVEGDEPKQPRKYLRGDFLYSFKGEKRTTVSFTAKTYVTLYKIELKDFKKYKKHLNIDNNFHLLRENSFFTYGFSFKWNYDLYKKMTFRKPKKDVICDFSRFDSLLLVSGRIELKVNGKTVKVATEDELFTRPLYDNCELLIDKNTQFFSFNKEDISDYTSILWSIFEEERRYETIVETGFI